MGAEDSDSVTLPNLLVRGTTGLRVVDASVLVRLLTPHRTATHSRSLLSALRSGGTS